MSYHFEKIIEGIYDHFNGELGRINVEYTQEYFHKFKEELVRRDILDAYDSLNNLINQIKYPLEKLEKFFIDRTNSTLNQEDAYIFTYFIQKHMEDLRDLAKEIDENDYSVAT